MLDIIFLGGKIFMSLLVFGAGLYLFAYALHKGIELHPLTAALYAFYGSIIMIGGVAFGVAMIVGP